MMSAGLFWLIVLTTVFCVFPIIYSIGVKHGYKIKQKEIDKEKVRKDMMKWGKKEYKQERRSL
jgi:hypothetical protein